MVDEKYGRRIAAYLESIILLDSYWDFIFSLFEIESKLVTFPYYQQWMEIKFYNMANNKL